MIEYGPYEKYEYNSKYFYDKALHQLSPKLTAIQTFVLSNGILVGLFQGKRGSHPELDFVVKSIIDYYIDFYNQCRPFSTVEERNAYIPQTVSYIMDKYGKLDIFKTLPMDYIALIIELFCFCEKRNEGAYMFKNLLLCLKDYIDGKANYMNVLKAAMPMH